MKTNIVLETERLILRPWCETDVNDLVEGLNNLEVSKYLATVPYPYTESDAKTFINYAINTSDYEFAIVLKQTNKVIGGTGITGVNNIQGTSTGGGIWLNANYHGKGYGYEAFYKRAEFAFNTLNLRRLENGFFEGNICSCNMQMKLGYKIEGTKRKKYVCIATKIIHNEVITGLLKEEFITKK